MPPISACFFFVDCLAPPSLVVAVRPPVLLFAGWRLLAVFRVCVCLWAFAKFQGMARVRSILGLLAPVARERISAQAPQISAGNGKQAKTTTTTTTTTTFARSGSIENAKCTSILFQGALAKHAARAKLRLHVSLSLFLLAFSACWWAASSPAVLPSAPRMFALTRLSERNSFTMSI